ncbi:MULTISPECIES: TetR/AcrR family transcriptional regulator [Bacillaceae]|jgi:TetR/AcrR family transcriptional repressor of lmrAB and yxaGH operons|uniref:TetR/AcrR family transcriptional regulator n=1 Tax=Ectobacillus funiculus TaxID=137993 RepID=A0ABV5WDI7_9BACI
MNDKNAKRETRDKIIKTASRLFQLQGYHATGLNQILTESETPKGSLYYHFPNGKEQLAIEAVNNMKDFVQAKTEKIFKEIAEPDKAIQFSITEVAKEFNKVEDITGFPVGLLAAETALMSEPLRKACQQAFETWEDTYTKKLIQGGFPEETAKELGMVINSMIEGGILRSLTNKDSTPLLLIAKQIPILLKK